MNASDREKLVQHLISVQSLVYRTIPKGLLEVTPHWLRGFTGVQLPIFNIFLPLKPAGLSDDTLADTSAFFASRDCLYAVELIHDLIPEGPDFLSERRYQSLPPQLAMVLEEGPPERVPLNSNIMIERVETVPSLTAFCSLLHTVYDFSLTDIVRLYPVSHLKNEQIRLYLAFLDEQPVGAGALLIADEVATITHTVTLDKYRRRGVATTLTHRMLVDARERGCDLINLFSTAQAYNVYSRLGFEMYTQRQWFLPPGISYE